MLAEAHGLVDGGAAMSNGSASFSVSQAALIGWTANNAIFMLCEIALGTLTLSASSAIAAFFVGSLVGSLLGFAGAIGRTIAAWTDIINTSISLVAGTMTGESWVYLVNRRGLGGAALRGRHYPGEPLRAALITRKSPDRRCPLSDRSGIHRFEGSARTARSYRRAQENRN